MKKKKSSTGNRIYRFFLRNSNIDSQVSEQYLLTEQIESEIFHQLKSVLRAQIGDRVSFQNQQFNNQNNQEYLGVIQDFNKKSFTIELTEIKVNQNFLEQKIDLALGLPNKPQKLEFILQKSVELGVNQINLIKTEFSNYPHQLKLDRLEKIVLEASEQSERSHIPKLNFFNSLQEFLKNNASCNDLLVAMERSASSLNLLNYQLTAKQQLLIGSEGGFSENEKELLINCNSQFISLGKNILRMETAAIAAVSILYLQAN